MPFVMGLVLAAGLAGLARLVGFDRDRGFYPAVLMVVASYYVLFAVMSGSLVVLTFETGIMALFLLAAIGGYRTRAWIITATALAVHGLFDVVHGHVMENPGVPIWWPAFCLAYDAGAAACMILAAALRDGYGAPEHG